MKKISVKSHAIIDKCFAPHRYFWNHHMSPNHLKISFCSEKLHRLSGSFSSPTIKVRELFSYYSNYFANLSGKRHWHISLLVKVSAFIQQPPSILLWVLWEINNSSFSPYLWIIVLYLIYFSLHTSDMRYLWESCEFYEAIHRRAYYDSSADKMWVIYFDCMHGP